MDALDSLWIWQEDDLRGRLPWYRQVSTNRMPAKFRIAQHIPVKMCLEEASEAALWDALEEKTGPFLDLWAELRRGVELPASGEQSPTPRFGGSEEPRPNLVDLCRELTQRMLRHCHFCRWNCQVDRSEGAKLGTCKLADDSRVSSYFHHRGEELIYRGQEGSGTIFFTSCNMRCGFCQNGDISTDKDKGQVVSPRTLATMAWLLRMEGAHNVNWVGGEVTIHLHTIVEAISVLAELQPSDQDLRAARPVKADYYFSFPPHRANALYHGAFNAPMLWNSNFFMSAPALKILRLLMDVWLPDLKFGPGRCAVNLSRTPWYWETVTGNIKTIYDWGEDFTIRHLVMPNHVECCTRPVLEWIAQEVPGVPVNVMDQFHPDNLCNPATSRYDSKYEDISRRPTSREVRQAFRYAKDLGLNFESLSYEKNTTGIRL
jgi:putative pyruvate formate lyase activating enzyme